MLSTVETAFPPAPAPVAAQSPDRAEAPGLLLVGLSGGPDSLALSAAAAHWARRGRLRVGAAVIDHGMQEGSALVAERAAEQARELGLDPVEIRAVEVRERGEGPEAAARAARYTALHEIAAAHGARAILLGHTLDDQAESVLLGLARGSGTRSLSGMPRVRDDGPVPVLRPLLELRRRQTEAICAAEQLEPWHDPANADETMLRARVRAAVLPELERQLGPGVAEALARTAAILGPDAELLERLSAQLLERAIVVPDSDAEGVPQAGHEPQPLVRRALAQACMRAGGERPTHERLTALHELASGHGEAGPVQMAGRVAAYRRRPSCGGGRAGTLELVLQPR
ncbi:MAG: tRNA lysidine(34) synthetase TilS [Kocuria palustris]|nr:MAG: tRNA lysidine(34) synthetase TilS [Kocuria palustris]